MNRSSPQSRIRRAALAGAVLLLAAVGLGSARPALADGADDATPDKMILELSNQVLDDIRKDSSIQAGNFDRLQKYVDERILPRVDFDKMTRLAVGRPWRGATPEQRGALIEQFRALLLRTYSGALAKVSDQKVRLRPSRGQDAPNDIIVRTQIVASQGDPVALDYRLEKTDAGWKIYDLNILGVWLVENYKSEFLEPLSQGGVDNLIQVLKEKNRKAAAAAKS
jgi:phospholipid transport system substrate-binding protein